MSEDLKIQGVISEIGHGTAEKRNKKIAEIFYRRLPELREFYLGTLNIRLIEPADLNIKRISSVREVAFPIPKSAYSWRKRPLRPETITMIPVYYSGKDITGEKPGFLYLASRSSRPRKGILELIAPEHLKEKHGLRIGDRMEIRIPEYRKRTFAFIPEIMKKWTSHLFYLIK